MNKSLTFRLMTENDIDEVLIVEEQSFTLPWSRDAFYHEMKNNRFAFYIILEDEGKVIGYCGSWIVMDEVHITNVAVLPAYRGQKLGEALMRQMMHAAEEKGAKTMTLEVRVTNFAAQSLYRKLGFQDGAIRKNYYTDNQEDALVMWVNL